MSHGTLFTDGRTRCLAPEALINYLGLDIKTAGKEDPVYVRDFSLNKTPTFVGPKGFKLTETIAITLYCMFDFFCVEKC